MLIDCADLDAALAWARRCPLSRIGTVEVRPEHPEGPARPPADPASVPGRGHAALEQIVREEAGLVLAALVASCGDLDLAEEAFQDAVATALERWPREGVPRAARGVAHHRGAPARDRSAAPRRDARGQERRAARERARAARRARGRARDRGVDRARRTAAADLHLLSSRARARGARRAHAAHARRPLDRGRRALVPRARGRRWPSGSSARSTRSATRRSRSACRRPRSGPRALVGARGDLPDLQRGLQRDRRERRRAARAVRGGDPAGADPRRARCPPRARCTRCCALVLLHDARRDARVGADGIARAARRAGPRALAPRRARAKGSRRCDRAARCAGRGPYQVQAAIAAAHATAPSRRRRRRGPRSPALYAELEALLPSPVVRVNRAVAEGRASGARAGLALLEPLALDARAQRGSTRYQPYHAARADLLRRAGRARRGARRLRARDRAVPRRGRAALPRAPARRAGESPR